MVPARKIKPYESELRVVYDRPVDVLVVMLGKLGPSEGEGHPRGIELDYSLSNGEPCAVKVIGFHRNCWSRNIENLALLIATHLSVDPVDITSAIERATAA